MVAPVAGKRRLMQVEIFPDRLLNIETAQALLNELNKISGITRMIVYGPRLPSEMIRRTSWPESTTSVSQSI